MARSGTERRRASGAVPDARIRALVIDDEQPARHVLCEYLAGHPEVEIVGECANGFEVVKAVAEVRPDLLFLDIQMPKLNGFEVLELLGDDTPAVIFVTAYDRYAIQAFEVHALDYLLKPFTAERLADALARLCPGHPAAGRPALPGRRLPVPELARTARLEAPYLERILVRQGSDIHVIAVEHLDYVEAQDDYVVLAAKGDKVRKQQTLTRLASSLNPDRFVRIHRSYVLNVERLERLELYAKDSRVGILRDGTRLPVSRSGYARLRKLL